MRRLLLLPVLALVGVMFVASPASAATVELSVDETAITAGGTVTLSWSVAPEDDGVTTLTASSTPATSFVGPREALTDEEEVTLTEPGEYTFTLTAAEEGVEIDGTDSVTVTVAPAEEEPTVIPVPAVTFPEPCVAILPEDPNVSYGVNYGQSGSELPAGTVDIADLLENGIPLEIVAVPNDGFAFPEGADNRFEIPNIEDCFGELVGSGLVETRAICKGVTFTNITDQELFVAYGGADSDRPDDDFELDAGESRTIDTDRDLVVYIAGGEDLDVLQVNEVEVEQDCTRAAAFPTVAPAAGSDGASTAGLGALAALTLAGGAALGARRLRRTA